MNERVPWELVHDANELGMKQLLLAFSCELKEAYVFVLSAGAIAPEELPPLLNSMLMTMQ